MKKSLLFCALMGFAVSANAGTILGAEDNSTGFFGATTESINLVGDGTVHYEFTNYSNCGGNWNNWLLVLTNSGNSFGSAEYAADQEIAVIRADRWGWGLMFNPEEALANGTMTNDWEDWDAWRVDQDGAKVNIDVTREGQTVTMQAVTTGKSGAIYNYTVVLDGLKSEVLGTFLTVDGCHLDIEVAEAVFPIDSSSVEHLVGTYNAVMLVYEEPYDEETGDYLPADYYDYNYDLEIEAVKGEANAIVIKEFFWGYDIKGIYDSQTNTINFPLQDVEDASDDPDYPYIYTFCSNTSGAINWEWYPTGVTATVDADGVITLENWCIAADGSVDYGSAYKGCYYAYQANTVSELSPVASGIKDIVNVTDANAPKEYYNINGVRMSGNNMPAGLYIVRQGNNVSKVIIK